MAGAFPLLIIDDFGMRKLSLAATEDLLEIIMRRHDRTKALVTSKRPVEDWGKPLGDPPYQRDARPPPASRTCAEVRSQKLVNKNRLSERRVARVKQRSPGCRPLAGSDPSTYGRF